jgi:putative flavoprotein involved in K+ transport
METRFDTIVIGGGQSGLATGYHLAKQGRSFVILDRHPRVGDAWRMRWDSLRVFTPAKYCRLPGVRFPASGRHFPTKDEVADYMAAYAKKFSLPVRTGVSVDCVTRSGDRFEVNTSAGTLQAANVVIATGAVQTPKIPAFAGALSADITQMHSCVYRNPDQLGAGPVLVVGLGNSGAEIARDVSRSHKVFISGSPSGEMPSPDSFVAVTFALPLMMFLATHLLTLDTPVGRRVLPKMHGLAAPLVRTHVKDLVAAGVERVPRVTGIEDGRPLLADGRMLDVANVIWCTGFRTDFSWIELPDAFAPSGAPIQYRGVVASEPGLYFVGQEFQYAFVSDVIPGVGRDAEYVVRHIAGRTTLGRVDAEDRMVRRDPAQLGVG